MAITKILNINSASNGNPTTHLKNALEYIQNPEKTEQCHLIGSVNCFPETAYMQMLDTKKNFQKSGKRQAYHVIISFAPEETVTPEQAKEVAEGFIEEVLKGEYEVTYAVHTDKEHMHVHIIWNSVNLVTGQKYNSPKGNWKYHLQPVTNKYCEKLGLQIMPAEYANEPMNMSKEEWEYEKSFKEYILDNALLCLAYAGNMKHFIFLMKRIGYEFQRDKYLSVRIPGMKLYHRLDALNDVFSKGILPTVLRYGCGEYYRKYHTRDVSYLKRAKLTPLQKKYYAKMYRLGLIEKRCFKYRSADMAKEIKRMNFLQEQYHFICKNGVRDISDLLKLREDATAAMNVCELRQKEIYRERYVRKRRCKSLTDFQKYQIWNQESSKELDKLKSDKKDAKKTLRMVGACMKENLSTAQGIVDELEELDFSAMDEIPRMEEEVKTVGEVAEEISIMILLDYGEYGNVPLEEKVKLFGFKIDDNKYNLELHRKVLKKLGLNLYESDIFEDYQGIYEATMRVSSERPKSKSIETDYLREIERSR